MTSPDTRRSRPLRVAGLALLGVAVGALLVGLVSLGGGGNNGGDGDGDNGGGIATGTDTPGQPPAGDPSATTDPAAPTTEAPAPTTETPAPPPPPATSAAPPAPPAPPQPEPRAPVRVYNNSTITGLAADAAADFRSAGWQVDDTANYSGGIIPTSTVYYRPGTDEEAAARALGNRFKLRVEPRFDGIAGSAPGLIVIVTNDYGSK